MPLSCALPDASSRCSPDVCVGVVLGDALHRLSVLGGREGMPRSLGSIYSGSVTRFLGGSLRGDVDSHGVVVGGGVRSWSSGVALSVDGRRLLVADTHLHPHAVTVKDFLVGDAGSLRRVIGDKGHAPLQFSFPRHVFVAADGFVFVADADNHRVQVLSPDMTFHAAIGVGHVRYPFGVCANADVVIVSNDVENRLFVFDRRCGVLISSTTHWRRDGARSGSDADAGSSTLVGPRGLCLLSCGRRIAVAEDGAHRVSVLSLDGAFVRHVGVGVLKRPQSVACSAYDELVVADTGSRCVRVFSDVGELLLTLGRGAFTVVAVRGGTVCAHDFDAHYQRCVAWSPWTPQSH